MEVDTGSSNIVVSQLWTDGGTAASQQQASPTIAGDTSNLDLSHSPPTSAARNVTCSRAPNGSNGCRGQPSGTTVRRVDEENPEELPNSRLQANEELQKFQALPPIIQKPLFDYHTLMADAFLNYATNGSATEALELLMEGAPEFLHTVDSPTYRDSPLGVALLKKKPTQSRFFLSLARKLPRDAQVVLTHRNSAGHTLLMLAVDLNSAECADILTDLLRQDPAQIYRCYDIEGRNVFHSCVSDGYATSFRIILEAVLRLDEGAVELSKQNINAALDMPDRWLKTPMHYMAQQGDVEMFNVLDTFARSKAVEVDYDTRFQRSDSKTPLMVAVEHGNYDVCKWLLEKGKVDVLKKHQASCFTALHFAVRARNCELIGLLRLHGALPDFYDRDCEYLDDYQTPLEIAQQLQLQQAVATDNRDAGKAVEPLLRYLTLDLDQIRQGYTYTMDSMSRSVSTASLSAGAAGFSSPSNPATFLRNRKVVQDLQLFGSQRREELSRALAAAGKSEQFIDCLTCYVPDLSARRDYLAKCRDPVFSSIVLLADTEQASRFVVKQVLLDIDAHDLVALVIPATVS